MAGLQSVGISCFGCQRRLQSVGERKKADLPQDRITSNLPPFSFIGFDCLGPFLVKGGCSRCKSMALSSAAYQ